MAGGTGGASGKRMRLSCGLDPGDSSGVKSAEVEERRIDGPAAFQRSSYHLYYTILINKIPPQDGRANRDVRLRRLHTCNN
jgi:hypothetical protein